MRLRDITVIREIEASADGTRWQRTWEFALTRWSMGDEFRFILTRYMLAYLPPRARKWRTEEAFWQYNRQGGRVKAKDVPLPDDVVAEAKAILIKQVQDLPVEIDP